MATLTLNIPSSTKMQAPRVVELAATALGWDKQESTETAEEVLTTHLEREVWQRAIQARVAETKRQVRADLPEPARGGE